MRESGELWLTTGGTGSQPAWCADSWASALPKRLLPEHTWVKVRISLSLKDLSRINTRASKRQNFLFLMTCSFNLLCQCGVYRKKVIQNYEHDYDHTESAT